MALSVSEMEYEHREVALRNKPQAMLEASPKGTVPVFVTEDDKVIDESLAIMHMALTYNDPKNWMRDTTGKTQDFIRSMDETFKHHLDRYKYASRYEANAQRGSVNLLHRAEAVKCLQKWETALAETKYLIDDAQSIADIATFPFIRQFAATEPEWWQSKPLPNVALWLTGLIESPLFQTIMVKHPLWVETPEE